MAGHTLRRCMGPLTRDGTIPGCPLCDTVDHELRTCPDLHKWTRRQAWNYLVKFRQGRPSFNIPWLLWELAPSFEIFLNAATDAKLPQSGKFAAGRFDALGVQQFDNVTPDPSWMTLMRPWNTDWMQPQAWHQNFGNFSMRSGESPLSVQQSFGEKGALTLPRKLAKQNEASLNVRPGSEVASDSISQVRTFSRWKSRWNRGGSGVGKRGGNRGGNHGGAQSGSMSQAPVFYPPPQAPVSYGLPMQAGSQLGYSPPLAPVAYGESMQAGSQLGHYQQQAPVAYGESMQAGSQFIPQQAPVPFGNPTQADSQAGVFIRFGGV
ncbi:hypothetical protein HYALB_00007645 [Hymenoscyphus albidus]|uniref:Uncharacterized protein n=1 Tax=Hymenoscyphus albidus TaxID=595503 RepID=A0A9N9LE26_9HELO|nr:hypothetical protein HYALB_00007645 [Hymenoscyphus albidus]